MRALGLFAVFLVFAPAFAGQRTGPNIVRSSETSARVSGLDLKISDPAYDTEEVGGSRRVVICIDGRYQRAGWSVVYGRNALETTSDGRFKLELIADAPRVPFEISATGPGGLTQREIVVVEFSGIEKIRGGAAEAGANPVSFSTSVGVSVIQYEEVGKISVSEMAATVKASTRFVLLSPHWDAAFNVYFNALPMAVTPSDVTMRFLGANARLGYLLPPLGGGWQGSLMTGVTYSRMYVTGASFGYASLLYPQLYPTFWRVDSEGGSFGFFFKYVPLTKTFFSLSLTERELAAGIAVSRPLEGGHSIVFTADVSEQSFFRNSIQTRSSALTAAVGYGF